MKAQTQVANITKCQKSEFFHAMRRMTLPDAPTRGCVIREAATHRVPTHPTQSPVKKNK